MYAHNACSVGCQQVLVLWTMGAWLFSTMTLHSHLTCSPPYLQDCCFQWFCELELECENTSFLLAGVEMEQWWPHLLQL